MREHRFIGDFDLSSQRIDVRDADLANQIRNVLRLQPGDGVVLCDGRGLDARARIAEIAKTAISFDIERTTPNDAEPAVRVVLYAALLKREHFDLLAQKAVEAGVGAIVPVVTRRTVKLDLREDRMRRIMKEAAEQSGRGAVPDLSPPLPFAQALEAARSHGATVLFELGAAPYESSMAVVGTGGSVGAFIGPEGGWDPEEVTAAAEAGCRVAGLGRRTLRAETAAIIAAYLLSSANEPTRR